MKQQLRARVRGLYAITACEGRSDTDIIGACTAAIAGGARLLQYRDKQADAQTRLRRAQALKRLCRQADTLLVINDDPELACSVHADGLHIGGEDGAPQAVRQMIPDHMLLGVSCYNSLERAALAANGGADYLAFGAMYPSSSKPCAVAASASLLAQAAVFQLPIVAIGGITADNAGPLIREGADAIAVINSLFSDDCATATQQRARELAQLFDS